MYGDDELYLRDCECGHSEHTGVCNRTISTYYPMGAETPAGATVTIVRPNTTDLQRVDTRCACPDFSEYDGWAEPDGY